MRAPSRDCADCTCIFYRPFRAPAQERVDILRHHTRHIPLAEDVNLEAFADVTSGHTGADLAAVCRHACMNALTGACPRCPRVQGAGF